ncbi:MAG TPA: hypothetical protein DCW46_08490 [Desulfotomaculum sp.]|nr:hypothetical protein [Desulfotomaculum sp.]
MLGKWRPHPEYRQYVSHELKMRWPVYLQSIVNHQDGIKKLWLLDLDELKRRTRPMLCLHWPPGGEPAEALASFDYDG